MRRIQVSPQRQRNISSHFRVTGREHYFAKDYEAPEEDFLEIDTTDLSVDECIDKIVREFFK